MLNSKNHLKKINTMLLSALMLTFFAAGCSTTELSTEMTSSLTDTTETTETAETKANSDSSVSASAVSNLSVEIPAVTDVTNLFTERDFSNEYEITSSINLNDVKDSVLTLTQEGVYELTGSFTGQVHINTEGKIQLVLNNAEITNPDGSAIYVENAKKVFITTAANSENTVSDGETYADSTISDAAIYSKDSLTLNGTGTLTVNGNFNEGITSKDELSIISGTIIVNSVGNGIKGKDHLAIYDGNLKITSGGDGLKSSNTTDEGTGFIYIQGGVFEIQAQQDGIQAETELLIYGGDFQITSNGGTANAEQKTNDFGGGMPGGHGQFTENTADTAETDTETEPSTKGMKAGTLLCIQGGTLQLNTADDALHSNGSFCLVGGDVQISAGNKGIHADTELLVSGGTLTILESYEALESAKITVSGGTLNLKSSDDGFNASDGSRQGAMGGSVDCSLTISGGDIYVNANGDGLDSNGTLEITGGTVYVDGPTNDGNGALDSNNSISLSGGTLIAVGSSGMAEYPENAEQNVIVVTLDSYQTENTLLKVCDENGNEVFSYTPSKKYNSVVLSSAELETGKTYTVYADGTEVGSVKLEDTVSFIGTAKTMGGGMMGGHGGMRGNMTPPTNENGESGMPEMPQDMQPPTNENGEITMPGNMRGGHGRKGQIEQNSAQQFGQDRVQIVG